MRLIDIDAFKEKFIKEHELYFNPAEARAVHCIFDALDNAPTAYDMEKVVAEIEKESAWHDGFLRIHTEEAIDIVRSGGVE